MSETIPDDVMKVAARCYTTLGRGSSADTDCIARAIMAERERCAQVIQDWRNKLDNRTEQAEGWAAEQLYYAVLGKEPNA
jgi:hypothetical protein